MTISDIWCEKYRPSTLDEIVLDKSTKNYFNKVQQDKNIPNVLFVGKPGIGKTSLAKIIVKDILKCQYLYINASDENGIDTIRTKVLQKALRNSIEEYHDLTRFVLTANYKHKIIPALQSRCQVFDITYDKNEYLTKLISIVKAEEIKINKENFTNIVNSCYPDFRKGINTLQKYYLSDGENTTGTITTEFLAGLIDLLSQKKYFLIRKT